MKWVPKFRYPATTGTVLNLVRSQGHWTQSNEPTGGFRRAAVVTVAASFTISRMRMLQVHIRFDEGEYAAVESLVEYMQDHPMTPVDMWLDKADNDTLYQVLLVSPVHGERWSPQRTEGFESDYETDLTFINAAGSSWGSLPFYDI